MLLGSGVGGNGDDAVVTRQFTRCCDLLLSSACGEGLQTGREGINVAMQLGVAVPMGAALGVLLEWVSESSIRCHVRHGSSSCS